LRSPRSARVAADVLLEGVPADVGHPPPLGCSYLLERRASAGGDSHGQARGGLPAAADRRAAPVTGEGTLGDPDGSVVGQTAAVGKSYVVDFEVHISTDGTGSHL